MVRSGLWSTLCDNLPTEQLVYVAALAADVPIIYGDRAKVWPSQRCTSCES
jgi:hypothetical protein